MNLFFASNTGRETCPIRATEQEEDRTSGEGSAYQVQAVASSARALQISDIARSEGVQAEQGDSVSRAYPDFTSPSTPDRVPEMLRFWSWCARFFPILQIARQSHARVLAVVWVRVGVKVALGRDPPVSSKNTHTNTKNHPSKTSYFWHFMLCVWGFEAGKATSIPWGGVTCLCWSMVWTGASFRAPLLEVSDILILINAPLGGYFGIGSALL